MHTENPDADRRDAQWAEALAGRPQPGTPPEVLFEAQMLRDALRRRRAAADDTDAAASLQRLRQALKSRCAGCLRRRERLVAWWAGRAPWGIAPVLAGVMTLAVFAVLTWSVLGPTVEPPTLRQALDVQLREVADPAGARNALAEALAASGARVQRYERLGRFGLDAQWVNGPVSERAREALAQHALVVPSDTVVKVEFTSEQP